MDNNRQVVCVGDTRGQTERVFERMRIALEEVGATMADIVQYIAYVTDVSKLNEFQEVRVGGGGLEPPTSAMSRRHSNQLS